jgi:hypothetical protein
MPFFYKRVFVTSTVHPANFGGVAAGDAICTARAAAANLPGTYKAWLSDATTSPSVSFTRSTIGYALVDGTVIDTGTSRVFYVAGSGVAQPLLAPINKTETGGAPPATTGIGGTTAVWTGTDFRGQRSSSGTCSDWTDTSFNAQGLVGDYAVSTTAWTGASAGVVCGGNKALYCFQQ